MSPRRNTRPGVTTPSPDTAPISRDTTPHALPGLTLRRESADQPIVTPPGRQAHAPEHQIPVIEITEITTQTLVSDSANPVSLDNYCLSPELLPRLSEPDATSGIRIFKSRRYVDLQEGGTVQLGHDIEQHFRARSGTELIASGPRLEQVQGSLLWRRIPEDVVTDSNDSQLIITRRRLADDEPSDVVAPKRAHTTPPPSDATRERSPAYRKHWEIEPRPTATDFITVEGVHYQVVTRSDARQYPIAYIKEPVHPPYEFDVLEATLRDTPDEQPRAAVQLPPDNHWEIDPRLPFEKPLTAYVKEFFPDVSTITAENIARKQFQQVNSSQVADAAGLTALRQIFHGWKNGTPSLHPQWSDPLLMLSTTPTTSGSAGVSRSIDLPNAFSTQSLDRLDFDPKQFQQQWHYFVSTYSPLDLKQFMATLLTRNGYTVFEPSSFNSFPALVFQRSDHDYLFFMSLHRTRILKIALPSHTDPKTTGLSLELQIGEHAAKAVKDAHKANKLIWLKGGSQILPAAPGTVFIIRDDNARL